MTNPKSENEIQELIARLRHALVSRTWVNLPEDIEQAANELERLESELAANQQLVRDLEKELRRWRDGTMKLEQKRSLIWHTAIRTLQALGYDFERNVIEFDKHVIDLIYSLGASGDYWGLY